MNEKILHTEVQNFINANINCDLTKLILKGSPFEGIHISELAAQIQSKSKCREKLPKWFHSKGIYYPPALSIEQTSSETTAAYKSQLVSGNTLIDITGGFGVDSYFFSKTIKEITHCEINVELSKIAAHNFQVLQADNIACENMDGLQLIGNQPVNYDWIYLDPSRRDEYKAKVFRLEDCLPDLTLHLDTLLETRAKIIIKLSPLLDISATLNQLKFVREVHVVAVKNEVKELIFVLDPVQKDQSVIKAVNLCKGQVEKLEGQINSREKALLSLPKKFLYEPNAAILKAGLFNDVSIQLNVFKLHYNSHLYTSNELVPFPGRRFEILEISNYNKKQLHRILPTGKANIATRNFPQTVAEIRKKTRIKDGGDDYLFFTTNLDNKNIVIHCKKV